MSRTAGALTPMMAQYRAMQADHPGCLLFFRMGDFYELFFEDAERAAAALDITLTRRGHGADGEIPMCGVPFHAVDGYLERLIRKGFKVAICEQLEDPAEAKKRGAKSLVKRDVVRIVTPGTLTEDGLLDARAHNHLAALARAGGDLALAWLDMSTGRFRTQDLTLAGLAAALAAIEPGELLVADTLEQDAQVGPLLADWRARITPLPASRFDSVSAERRLKEVFAVAALDAFGSFARAEIAAAGALLAYVELTQKGRLPRLEPPARLENAAHLVIDAASRRNLELSQSLSGTRAGSLLHAIDRTVTGPGGRLLASRLATPLCAPHAIRLRLDQIEALVEDGMWRDGLRRQLRALPDLPRALSRLSLGRGGPRDLRAIGEGLRVAAALQHELEARPGPLQVLAARSEPCPDLAEQLLGCLIEQPPLLAREGGFIAAGADARLDEERSLRDHGRKKIAAMEADLRGELGIPSLKIRHNNLIGYHIEVSATQRAKVPERFIQRQSMANATRYTTGALAELAEAISEAGMKALKHELALFDGLVAAVNARADAIARTADVLAELDVAAGLADLAVAQRYVRPELDDSDAFAIVGGRHPVVEQALAAENAPFVPNDADLSPARRLWLLTGPNMAGKSTFLRQNALIVIMAQLGSFVPATAARIGVVDKLFSRVGAADDLARGRSTFMVEMVETAAILNQATDRSLVILDEIGRGTATYDGLSLAWAVVEYLHDRIRCRGLFATHYHELVSLTAKLDHLVCRTLRVKEWRGQIHFLHEIGEGSADRSYGIHVARLAGLPEAVLQRAQAVLEKLEAEESGSTAAKLADDLPLFAALAKAPAPAPARSPEPSRIEARLAELRPDDLSPREALAVLYELHALLKDAP